MTLDPRAGAFAAYRRADADQILTGEDVQKLNAALDAIGFARIEQPEQAPVLDNDHMRTSEAGIQLIHYYERCAKKISGNRYKAYPDPGTGGKPWTIGWGSTTDEKGRSIQPGTVWSKARCDARFVLDMLKFERHVRRLIDGVPTTQAQFDALVSFTYNCGPANLGSSTLLRRHKAGRHAEAANEFKRWNKANKRVMRGLTLRRAKEAHLYRNGT